MSYVLLEGDLRYQPQLPPAFAKPQIIGYSGITGGSVKSTTAVTLGVVAALRGYRIGMIGLDLQGDMTFMLGHAGHEGPTIWEVMGGEASLSDVMVPARFLDGGDDPYSTDPADWKIIPNLWIAPESEELENAESEMRMKPMKYEADWLATQAPLVMKEFQLDALFVDFPAPSGLPTNNAIGSVDRIVGCTRSQLKEFRGIGRLEERIRRVRKTSPKWDRGQELTNIMIGMVPSNGNVYAEDREAIIARYGDRVLPLVPLAEIVARAYSWATPVPILDRKHRVTKAFEEAADAMGFPDREGVEPINLPVPTAHAQD